MPTIKQQCPKCDSIYDSLYSFCAKCKCGYNFKINRAYLVSLKNGIVEYTKLKNDASIDTDKIEDKDSEEYDTALDKWSKFYNGAKDLKKRYNESVIEFIGEAILDGRIRDAKEK